MQVHQWDIKIEALNQETLQQIVALLNSLGFVIKNLKYKEVGIKNPGVMEARIVALIPEAEGIRPGMIAGACTAIMSLEVAEQRLDTLKQIFDLWAIKRPT